MPRKFALTPQNRKRLRLAFAVPLLYLILLAAMYFEQTWLVLPGRRSQHWKSAVVHPSAGAEIVHFTTASGDSMAALYGSALTPQGTAHPNAARQPTLLYFYGTGAWLKTVVPEIEAFRRLGLNVLCPEYVGYGMSEGAASEANCYASADAAYDYLLNSRNTSPRRIVSVGSSLGGAVAIDLAARKPVAGLVTFSTFTSMNEMAQLKYGFVPVGLLLNQRFASVDKVAQIRCPILMFHGTSDPFIPYSMMERLAARATSPVTQIPVPDADHDHFFATGGYRQLPALSRFIEQIQRASAPVACIDPL